MNKILLIYPPYERFKYAAVGDFPVGLGYLATMLEQAGFWARIYNADHGLGDPQSPAGDDLMSRVRAHGQLAQRVNDGQHFIWQEVRACLEEHRPDLVGVYATTAAYPMVLRTLALAKEVLPGCRTILGGPHVTVLPDQVMARPEVDFIIRGEGEFALTRLCQSLRAGDEDYKSIPGLGWREGGQARINHDYKFIEDLDALPLVNRELLLDGQRFPAWVKGGYLLGSRGCPYRCTFCASAAIWHHRARYRSVDSLMAELKELMARYQLKSFSFWDDTFTNSQKFLQAFCQRLIAERLEITWSCSTRANLINEENLRLLKDSGCTQIAIGVESGSDRVLKAMKKGVTTEVIRRAGRLIKKAEIEFQALFVMGLPYETAEDLRLTINIIKDLQPDSVNVSTFVPYPGTEAHDAAVEAGMMPAGFDWSTNLELGHHSLRNRFTPHVPEEEFKAIILEALELAKEINQPSPAKTLRRHWRRRGHYLSHPGEFLGKVARRLGRAVGRG
ncbi:MAG: radical SAM protein [Desulfarculus sp.]|nr:radical SAM protein [Desulfarculus sp.]